MSKATLPSIHHPDVHSCCAVTRHVNHPHLYCNPLRNPQWNSSAGLPADNLISIFHICSNLLNGLVHNQISLIHILQLLGTIAYKPLISGLLIVLCTSSKALMIFGLNVPSVSERYIKISYSCSILFISSFKFCLFLKHFSGQIKDQDFHIILAKWTFRHQRVTLLSLGLLLSY